MWRSSWINDEGNTANFVLEIQLGCYSTIHAAAAVLPFWVYLLARNSDFDVSYMPGKII
jgi:hypothetical protein